jgi:hypothetical protein
MPELARYDFDEPQSELNRAPNTIAAAATITPVHKLTFITGTTQIATITAPVNGYHELVFIFTNATPGAFLTSGNVQRAVAPAQNVVVSLHYDPITKKYWG